MLLLHWFVDSFSFDYINEYIKEQINTFEINNQIPIFWNEWKHDLYSKLNWTVSYFQQIWTGIIQAQTKYNSIDEHLLIDTNAANIVGGFQNMAEQIDALVMSGTESYDVHRLTIKSYVMLYEL